MMTPRDPQRDDNNSARRGGQLVRFPGVARQAAVPAPGGVVKPVRMQRSRLPPTMVSTVSASASNFASLQRSTSERFKPSSL